MSDDDDFCWTTKLSGDVFDGARLEFVARFFAELDLVLVCVDPAPAFILSTFVFSTDYGAVKLEVDLLAVGRCARVVDVVRAAHDGRGDAV